MESIPEEERDYFVENISELMLPKEISWKIKSVLSKPVDMGICNAGWAFATVGAVEAAHAIKAGKEHNLAP